MLPRSTGATPVLLTSTIRTVLEFARSQLEYFGSEMAHVGAWLAGPGTGGSGTAASTALQGGEARGHGCLRKHKLAARQRT